MHSAGLLRSPSADERDDPVEPGRGRKQVLQMGNRLHLRRDRQGRRRAHRAGVSPVVQPLSVGIRTHTPHATPRPNEFGPTNPDVLRATSRPNKFGPTKPDVLRVTSRPNKFGPTKPDVLRVTPRPNKFGPTNPGAGTVRCARSQPGRSDTRSRRS